MIKIASYAYDSLVLDGFNEARNNVPVRVSLLNQSNEASKAMEFTFNTQDSGPVAFFNDIEVLPYWDGFQVKYKVPGAATGLCNVFFIGTNPMTRELDTLLLETFAIEAGENVKYFSLAQKRDVNTVVVKTEGFVRLFRFNIPYILILETCLGSLISKIKYFGESGLFTA